MDDVALIDGPWTVGTDEDQDEVCSIYAINAGFREVGPGSQYRYCALLRMQFEETDEFGSPTHATREALSDLGDRIERGVERNGDSVLVGRYTTNGLGRTFCFYTKDLDSLSASVGPLVAPYGRSFDDTRTGDDPTWSVYGDLLGHAEAGAPDVHLVKRLDEMGVNIREAQMVEHVLRFPTVESAQEAVTDGFSDVDSEGPYEAEPGTWSVVVRLCHTLQFADLAHWRHVLIRDVCSPLGGSYDGWGITLADEADRSSDPPDTTR